MPELPEVQTVVNSLKPVLINRRITRIIPIWEKALSNFSSSDLFENEKEIPINDITRRAKFIIFHFPSSILAVHLRMTGKLYVNSDNNIPKHATVIIQLDDGKKLIFKDTRKFGRIYLYPNLFSINERHGPEPLGENFSVDWLQEGLKKRKRNIKALLLDQSFLSGLGNIYTDEVLWSSGVHPHSISNVIPNKKIIRIHTSVKSILEAAIIEKGTTIIDFSFLNGESGRYSERLCVFGRAGKPCTNCERNIIKIKVAGRGTYVCNYCQKVYKNK